MAGTGNAAREEAPAAGRAIGAAAALLLASVALPIEATAAGCRDRTPASWDVEVAPAGEPGDRLEVRGRVISRANGAPLAGITVYVYHADANGNYVLPGHEKEPPRLCGILRTNQKGEYRLRTSMPGGYEGYAPHVHFEIWGPRVLRQYTFVNLGPPQARMDTSATWTLMTPATRRRPDATGITRPLRRGADGVLHCTRDLAVEVR